MFPSRREHYTINVYGKEFYIAVDEGLGKWVSATDEGKVGRGRIIIKKL